LITTVDEHKFRNGALIFHGWLVQIPTHQPVGDYIWVKEFLKNMGQYVLTEQPSDLPLNDAVYS